MSLLVNVGDDGVDISFSNFANSYFRNNSFALNLNGFDVIEF